MPNTKPERLYQPGIVFIFYDEKRGVLGDKTLGPWRGSFDWQKETRRIEIPPKARECIVRVGLLGATGEISFDGFDITAGEK